LPKLDFLFLFRSTPATCATGDEKLRRVRWDYPLIQFETEIFIILMSFDVLQISVKLPIFKAFKANYIYLVNQLP